jgi:hypothetical protein
MTSDDPARARPAASAARAALAGGTPRVAAWLAALAPWLEGRSELARTGAVLAISAVLWSLVAAVVLAVLG